MTLVYALPREGGMKGWCSGCPIGQPVRKDGMIREHKTPKGWRYCRCEAHLAEEAVGYRCAGSGKPPDGLIEAAG